MKKFALIALLLSLGTVVVGCNKPADKKPADAAPAAAPAETPPAEPAK